MIADSNFTLERNFLTCPFSHKCNLPKIETLCIFPEYKICPDYNSNLKSMRTSIKILH
jgi:hypothetical protein